MWNVKLSGMASAGTRWKTADLSKMQDKDTTLRAEVARNILMTGHLGKKKTLDRIQQRFYWPSMFHDVSN